jgi:hypothetical protein
MFDQFNAEFIFELQNFNLTKKQIKVKYSWPEAVAQWWNNRLMNLRFWVRIQPSLTPGKRTHGEIF